MKCHITFIAVVSFLVLATYDLNATLNPNEILLPIKISLAHTVNKVQNKKTFIILENNTTSGELVSDIELYILFNGTIFTSYSIRELHNQSIAIPTVLPESDGEYAIKVTYLWKGKTISVTKDISLLLIDKKSILSISSFIPLITSIIGILIGALLTHYLLRRRERIRSRFEWKKLIFEKYEKDYREFLAEWNGDQSYILLKEKFNRLRTNAIIPSSILKAYNKTYAILTDDRSEEKESVCKKLMDQISDYIHNPHQ